MPSYAVDTVRQPMTATGIVEPVMEWEETSEGKRRPSRDKQARDEATGMPLWGVEVLYIQTSFGRRSTVAAKVTVGHESEPKPAPLTPIGFHRAAGGGADQRRGWVRGVLVGRGAAARGEDAGCEAG